MIRRILTLFTFLMIIINLSGCLYPAKELAQNKVPSDAQISMVQTAVDQFQNQNNGILPIKTMPSDTPIFEKYIIDFTTLKNNNHLSELPGNSFERGGYFQYALVYVETNPTVKLIDVRTAQKLQEVYRKLHIYRQKNQYLPLSGNIAGKYFEIDFNKLGYAEEQFVISPYSNQSLPIIIDTEGNLYIDYRSDLHQEVRNNDYSHYDDVRYILVDNYPFLPAYSPKYEIKDNYPVLIEN